MNAEHVPREVGNGETWDTMDFGTWLAIGRFLFGNPAAVKRAIDQPGVHPLPHAEFRYWCSQCKAGFPSITTPTRCPNGHKAEDVRHILLEHKGHTAATFPFDTPLQREMS